MFAFFDKYKLKQFKIYSLILVSLFSNLCFINELINEIFFEDTFMLYMSPADNRQSNMCKELSDDDLAIGKERMKPSYDFYTSI